MGNSTACKILTPKISSWNFAHVITSARLPATQILVSIGTLGASPQIGEILPPCDFFWLSWSCPVLTFVSILYAEIEPLDRFSRFMAQTTCFRARMVLLGVRTMGGHIWGKYAPKTPPKCAWIGNFHPAKTAKYKNRNISKTIQETHQEMR